MRRLKIEPHLSLEELGTGYRQAAEATERTHYQIIGWLAQDKSSAEVAELSGYSVKWIRQLAGRYNARGAAGLGDQRHHNPGQKRLLSAEQEQQLAKEVEAAQAAPSMRCGGGNGSSAGSIVGNCRVRVMCKPMERPKPLLKNLPKRSGARVLPAPQSVPT